MTRSAARATSGASTSAAARRTSRTRMVPLPDRLRPPACACSRDRATGGAVGAGRGDCRVSRPGSSWRAAHAREAAMAPTTTRRTVLAGGTMLLAGRAAAQQAATLRLYSADYEPDTTMLAFEVPSRTGGRYEIEAI